MPCYDHRNSTEYMAEQHEEQMLELQERNDELASLLCQAGRDAAKYCSNIEFSPEVEKWWAEHKVFDAERGEPW